MTDVEYRFRSREIAPGVHLHHHASNKNKTNALHLYWVGDLGADVAERALLPNVLTRGTRSWPDMTAVNRRLEMLYGTSLNADVLKVDERHVIAFSLDFVNDGYLPPEEAILSPCSEFCRELLHEPHLDDGTFPAAVVDQEKVNQRRHIESLINDKTSYAYHRCVAATCQGEEFARYKYGTVAEVDAIDGESLSELWRGTHTDAETHIYFSGDVALERVAEAVAPLAGLRSGSPAPLRPLAALRAASEPREIIEELDVSQAVLVLSYRVGTRHGDPASPALAVANGILGAFSHSKLFQNVRERASLCYSIHSMLDLGHGLLFIVAGISGAARERAQALILEQLDDLRGGEFTDEELSATLIGYENRMRMIEDSPTPLMRADLSWRLVGAEYDHQQQRQRIAAVTRDEVVEVLDRVQLDTVYLLRPAVRRTGEEA